MCLLDRVTQWDGTTIVCTASSHRALGNPLRANGRLGAACGVEYAAQAMAVHGSLLAQTDGAPRAGYLASVRSVELQVQRLDGVAADLTITAERITGDANNILYRFTVAADGQTLLSGRAAVVLDATLLRS
ncbi:3-hydroxylacyl-ACP dehydratase [Rhodoferax sp. WC2427]|uniref:3-hydroxylacyl-ACP dehydratase n=1 Tax=Rhodoferax sp. WC2427 TaxID=3234144 RepID=UPI003466559F